MQFSDKQVELHSNGSGEPKLFEPNVTEERTQILTSNQRSSLNQNLKDYISRVNSLEIELNKSDFEVLYSHNIKEGIATMNHLSFEISKSHTVSIEDYLLGRQFENKDEIESYKLLNERLLNQTEFPNIKFSTQDVVMFEEEIVIENTNCQYWGFKDKEPFDKPQILFEIKRSNLQQIVQGIIEYRTEMKN
jgi:hypothetical protein